MKKPDLLWAGFALLAVFVIGEMVTYAILAYTGKMPVTVLTDWFAAADRYLIAGGSALFTAIIHGRGFNLGLNVTPTPQGAPYDPPTQGPTP